MVVAPEGRLQLLPEAATEAVAPVAVRQLLGLLRVLVERLDAAWDGGTSVNKSAGSAAGRVHPPWQSPAGISAVPKGNPNTMAVAESMPEAFLTGCPHMALPMVAVQQYQQC